MQSTECSVQGCTRKHEARGYCHTHYIAKRRSGELTNINRPLGLSVQEAFLWKCQRLVANPETGCVEWTGSRMSNGYGLIHHSGSMYGAHRVAYEIAHGSIPDGMLIDHVCRNRACVNALHLRLATKAQNGENQGIRADNTSGFRGVSRDGESGRWIASVTVKQKRVLYKRFDTIEEAAAAALEARVESMTHNVDDRPEPRAYLTQGLLHAALNVNNAHE